MKKLLSIVSGLMLAVCVFAGEPTEINVGRIQVITEVSGCIVYGLFDDPTDRVFEFPIKLAEGESDVELGRTYTLSEMNTVYTYWMKSDYMTHALYTEATFRKTEITEDLIKIEATATDTNGDSWVLTYDESQEESGVSHTYSAAKPAKRIENGHVIIEKDGIRFNVLGAEMK